MTQNTNPTPETNPSFAVTIGQESITRDILHDSARRVLVEVNHEAYISARHEGLFDCHWKYSTNPTIPSGWLITFSPFADHVRSDELLGAVSGNTEQGRYVYRLLKLMLRK